MMLQEVVHLPIDPLQSWHLHENVGSSISFLHGPNPIDHICDILDLSSTNTSVDDYFSYNRDKKEKHMFLWLSLLYFLFL